MYITVTPISNDSYHSLLCHRPKATNIDDEQILVFAFDICNATHRLNYRLGRNIQQQWTPNFNLGDLDAIMAF